MRIYTYVISSRGSMTSSECTVALSSQRQVYVTYSVQLGYTLSIYPEPPGQRDIIETCMIITSNYNNNTYVKRKRERQTNARTDHQQKHLRMERWRDEYCRWTNRQTN